VPELCGIHNEIPPPSALTCEEGYLIFMNENQSVVAWGIRVSDLDEDDPPTWQRNNTEPAGWFTEDKTFSQLLASMFDWYRDQGMWDEQMLRTDAS
jgi:hypothetical protein